MNRDWRFIKLVLDLADTMGRGPNPDKMALSDIVEDQNLNEEEQASLLHTIKILVDRGLIVVDQSQNQDAGFWTLDRLTWDGHDYLDDLNKKAKQ